MQVDPMEEWRRLTGLYAAMADEQLEDLAADFSDLTEAARQALRDEMRKRGLGDPQAPMSTTATTRRFASSREAAAQLPTGGSADEHSESEDGGSHEYTWKTVLCECETSEQAWQVAEMLRRAGIESWTQRRESYLMDPTLDLLNPQVLVAADELDRAREILRHPIPQEIVELSRIKPEDYEPPACPGCGAADPVLEGVDPVNSWRCESCGRQWSEAAEEAAP
jgi:hypothetical protein